PGERNSLPKLTEFLDRAASADRTRRFKDGQEALTFLNTLAKPEAEVSEARAHAPKPTLLVQRANQQVHWLNSLLRIYPGSPHGNSETRGLDSDFALATYVQTPLEEALFDALKTRQTRLVILCGNAGDGKTALL